MEVKDVDGVTMVPLDDGRVAYVDKAGTIFMYGLKEEFLASQLNDNGGVSDADQVDPEFIFTNIFQEQDQCAGFVLEENKGQELMVTTDIDHDVNIEEDIEEVEVEEDTSGSLLNLPQAEDDCVEQVTVFKCRACMFTAPEKSSIVQHYSQEHMQRMMPQENLLSSAPGALPVHEEFERLAQSVAGDSNEGEGERLLFLCGKCQCAFETIELCRQHMIQEHKYVSGKSKSSANPSSPNTLLSNVVTMPAGSNLLPAVNSPLMTVMDVGGIKVEWQPLSLIGASVDGVSNPAISSEVPQEPTAGSSGDKAPTVSESDEQSKLEVQKVRERERKIKCTFRACPFKFSNQKALQIHKSCHSKDLAVKEFHCVHCDEKFVRWRLCSSHLWRVHEVDVDLLACPVCNTYKAATPMKLEIHMRTHGDQRPFCCQHCSKSFKQSAQLRNHCASVHLNKKSGDAGSRWYMEQRCNLCGKTYADSKCLKKHIQAVHSKMKPYVCTVCGHSSAGRAMLALHLRQHTGEKPHACTHCDYRTGDHNTLRRHMMRHTGQRQYQCPHCPYAAIQSNSFKVHLRSRHPGESGMFSCTSCTFQTVSQEGYFQHVSDHKKGLIPQKEPNDERNEGDDEIEFFPGNVAAAHLVYRYLGTFLQEPGRRLPNANITDSHTSPDGTTQSITIQIPTRDDSPVEVEDEESSHSFLLKGADDDIGIDTGGITIPAEPTDATLIES